MHYKRLDLTTFFVRLEIPTPTLEVDDPPNTGALRQTMLDTYGIKFDADDIVSAVINGTPSSVWFTASPTSIGWSGRVSINLNHILHIPTDGLFLTVGGMFLTLDGLYTRLE